MNSNDDGEIEGEWDLKDDLRHNLKDLKIYGRRCNCFVDVKGDQDLAKQFVIASMDKVDFESQNFEAVIGGNLFKTNISRHAERIEIECDKN
eukprot:CAMPEP_0170513584 /NCGR_PEP_ID=MMETSP0209-20121228/100_1 /TAXON_ID=665100 ORGANISM="Litonotus pictus, Strain P1" /NCGR_SAMPLE_ID=MMETSP0209 /ASSEMBLY_ACC=CAM_ASM_000301 /LENGTH=91 /DNA_ID=CAMNT_0010797337 /DNA_START=139 /DNA_END=414 /DNA_ORIENTATION=+